HLRVARRVHGREGSERPPADGLVLGPERDLPRGGETCDHPGHGLWKRLAGRRRPFRLLDAGRHRGPEAIDSDYPRHSRAALEIAREHFAAEVVLGRLLEQVGMPRTPPGLVIAPVSRRPTTLEPATVE